MSTVRVSVRSDDYRDSGSLMRLTQQLQTRAGITRAAAVMGTARNKEMLESLGFASASEVASARGGDLVIVVHGETEPAAEAALAVVDELLAGGAGSSSEEAGEQVPTSIASALEADASTNLVVISVPGPFAARASKDALRMGRSVFLFSDGVSVEDEVALKQLAHEKGVFLFGPDCGTAIIDGAAIGFANRVRRGSIGVVGASGTGIQEVTTLIHRSGAGISQAIGTGGRDLSAAVGGATMLRAVEQLGADPGTKVIVCISKPPEAAVAEKVKKTLIATGKPAVICFLGAKVEAAGGALTMVSTLEDAANKAVELGGGRPRSGGAPDVAAGPFKPEQTELVGLFCGGTLGLEAISVLSGDVQLSSNLKYPGITKLESANGSGHRIIDLGDDDYTAGRPHPMIDPSIRNELIAQLADAPKVRVLLLDVVLGYGSHDAPVATMADALRQAQAAFDKRGGHLAVVASVTGTDLDTQRRNAQVQLLEDLGAIVADSNAEAARIAASIVRGAAKEDAPPEEPQPFLGQPLKTANAGLDVFADTMSSEGVPVTRIAWSPPAGGDEKLAAILSKLL